MSTTTNATARISTAPTAPTRKGSPLGPLVLVGALALGVVGCQQSSVSPHETVTIEGTVLTETGAPDAGAKVGIYDHDIADAILTLFLSAIFPVDESRADASGRYTLQVDGALANGLFGARSFSLMSGKRVNNDFAAPDVTVGLRLMQTSVQAPPMQIWDGYGRSSIGVNVTRLSYDDLYLRTGYTADSYRVELESGGVPMFDESVQGTSFDVPTRALQDLVWMWRPSAFAHRGASGTQFRFCFKGRLQQVNGLYPAPPTRYQPAFVGASARPLAGLTDGRFASVLPQPTAGPAWIEVDLAQTRGLDVVYLYGLGLGEESEVSVELYRSGLSTGVVGRVQTRGGFVEIPLAAGASGDRIVITTQVPVTELTEIAAY